MSGFLLLLWSGMALGAIYALIALGFVVIYRASTVFNFALGEFVTLGAFTMTVLVGLGLPWGIALAGAMIVAGATSSAVDRIVLRPLVGRPVFVTIIVTIFVGLMLRTAVLLVFGTESRMMKTPWTQFASVDIGGTMVLINSLAAIGTGAACLLLFFVLIKRTRWGVAMRATASDQETALAMGIPVGRVLGWSWFVAGALAALAGVFLGMFPRTVEADLGFVALRAFPAVIVGGLESPTGAVVAGFALGILEVMTQGYVNQQLGHFGHDFHTVFPYLAMILFLVVRPYGLFGTHEVERV